MSDERLKMMFGFSLMISLVALAAVIAIGHVKEETSFGLQYILGALSALSGSFAQWAFSAKQSQPPDQSGNMPSQSVPEPTVDRS